MPSHRMSDQDRPRRPVPAWVTAPPTDAPAAVPAVDGLEARPAPSGPAHVADVVGPGTPLPTAVVPGPLATGDVVVPDYPPQEHLLPPAPTSPAVDTVPFDRASAGPAPVSPVDLAPPVRPTAPAVPTVGQPRFSVPGLEHVVVEGAEPVPSGPIGYRTPARFARQQAPLPAPAPAPMRPFDAVLAPPAVAPDVRTAVPAPASAVGATPSAAAPTARPAAQPAPTTAVAPGDEAEPRLPADDQAEARTTATTRRRLVGPTVAALLGAVAGVLTIGLAAWWFTAPDTVHGVAVPLGLLGTLLSIVTLRDRTATWQRSLAQLGAVLGGVGTLVVLWAVASALLPLAGVGVPDVTGTGTVPTLAP